MLNQELKNKIAPWQKKGRWYHAFIESDGTTSSITVSDLDCTLSGATLTLPEDFTAIDVKFADVDLAGSKTISSYEKKTAASGKQIITLPAVADYTYCDLWMFGYFKD